MKRLEKRSAFISAIRTVLKIIVGMSVFGIYVLCASWQEDAISSSTLVWGFALTAVLIIIGLIGLDIVQTAQLNLQKRVQRHSYYMERNNLYDMSTAQLYDHFLARYGANFLSRRTGTVLGVLSGNSSSVHCQLLDWCIENGFPYLSINGSVMFSEDGSNWKEAEGVRKRNGDTVIYERKPFACEKVMGVG